MSRAMMCRLFGISRQGYYQAKKRENKVAAEQGVIISMVAAQRRILPRLGGRKLHYLLTPELEEHRIKCGRDKLFDILRDAGMLVKRKKNYTRTTNSMHRFRKYPNLIEGLEITRPEQVWVSDITYIRTRSGFLYLSLVTDAFSRRIMGFELADNLRAESSIKALRMAISGREYPGNELTHHSDRGLQYCTPAYTDTLEDHNIQISMTSRYDPYENAIAERVNGILKSEFDVGAEFVDPKQAKRVVKESIAVYNGYRPHLSCNYRTPKQAHLQPDFKPKKWKNKFSSPYRSKDENKVLSLNNY